MREHFILSWRVAMRHWSIFKKDFFANVLPTVVDPALFIVVFGVWLGSQMGDLGGRPYLQYMAPGIVSVTVLFTAYFESSYGFYVRLVYENIFKALMTTPIGAHEILTGEFIWVGLKGAIMAFLVGIVLLLFGVAKPNYVWLMPIIGGLLSIACGAMGLVSTGYVRNMNQFQTVYALLISPMFFVSGVFYPIEQMPKILQYLCYLSPLYHGVRLSQSALWAEGLLEAWLIHGGALLAITAVLVFWAWKKIYPKLYS
ncbi:MAG: ABC transporter permease [Proteobacteria bacterium]|nr:MAG: ABC transporter permease [Pseudomonadota bacterium]